MMQSKKRVKGKRGVEVKKKRDTKIVAVLLIIFILAMSLIIVYRPPQRGEWSVSRSGLLSYPSDRGAVAYTAKESENNTSYIVEKIEYESKDANITAILRIPKSDKKVPAVIIIPGAGVSAEGVQGMAKILSSMGYASLAIDKRVSGIVQHDYLYFKEGGEPTQNYHARIVWDVLRAYDLLKSRKEIDGIGVLGESEGGRIAIISAAVEPGIKGMIGISAFGDDSVNNSRNYSDAMQLRFFKSIDPDEYIGLVSPRRVVMFHDVNDTIVSFETAQKTFARAKQPKEFYAVSETPPCHGEFCSSIKENFAIELGRIFAG